MEYKFKKHLQELDRIRVGSYREGSTGIFLDRNERVVPFDDETIKCLCQRLARIPLNLYPDIYPFYRKLSSWLDMQEDQIYVTDGVCGAIRSLIETIAEPGDNIVFPAPTFAMYPVYSQMFNLESRTCGYTDNYELDIEKLLGLIDDRTAIVFLPNPNVPIEGMLELDAVISITEHCLKSRTFLAIDEVYFPYGGTTAINLIDRFDNLFVMRSFSKAFGLAGIRVGYLLGSCKNIEYVSKMRAGYETNTVSMEIASFFIDNYDLVEDYIRNVKDGLDFLKGEFNKLGLEHNGGNASNFIYINMHDRILAEKIVHELKMKNIHIRGGWPDPYSSGFSVTGAPRGVMEEFVDKLREVL